MTVLDIAAEAIETGRAGPAAPTMQWRPVIGIDRVIPRQRGARLEPACWGVDPEMFFGPADSPSSRSLYPWEQRALAVCAGCPLRTACLAEALKFPAAEQHGVVGGMTAEQRRMTLRASRRGRGRVQRPRRGGPDPFPALGEARSTRSSAAAPAARGTRRSPQPARP